MRPRTSTAAFIATFAIVGLGLLVALLLPSTRPKTVATTPPASITLNGIVRDFRADHPDFGLTDDLGPYAGTVDTTLGAVRTPLLTSGGYLVAAPWRNADGRPIAPHLFGTAAAASGATAGVHVRDTLRMTGGTTIDGATPHPDGTLAPGRTLVTTNSTAAGAVSIDGDSSIDGDVMVGPGGDPYTVISGSGPISGAKGTLTEPLALPAIVVPGDDVVGPNLGDVWFKHVPSTISANMHVDNLRISTEAVVTVSGNITILIEGEFRTETKGVFKVLPGSSLDIYVTGSKFTVETRCQWSDPYNTRVWVVGSPQMKIQTNAAFYGSIFAPDAKLLVQTDADVFGSVVCRDLECKTGGSIHGLGAPLTGCLAANDTAGSRGVDGSGGITSAATFDQWFRTVDGENMAGAYPITLVRSGAGIYEFTSTSFHPADGRLLGNDGAAHNANLTYEVDARFAYEDCGGQFIELGGGDGAWVFVDEQLVIDLGGLGSTGQQYVNLDRLGLVPGREYTFRLFYAQRRGGSSTLTLRTNVQLRSLLPIVGDMYD